MALPRNRFAVLRRLREDLWFSLLRPSLRTAPLLIANLGPKLPPVLRELRPPPAPPRGRRRTTPSLAKRQLWAWIRVRQFYRLPRSRPLRTLRRRLARRAGRRDRRLLAALEGRAAALLVRAGLVRPTAVRQQLSHGRVAVGRRTVTRPGRSVGPAVLVRTAAAPDPLPLGPGPHLEVSLAAGAALAVRTPRPADLAFPFDLRPADLLSRP
jgi:hypothetical protein